MFTGKMKYIQPRRSRFSQTGGSVDLRPIIILKLSLLMLLVAALPTSGLAQGSRRKPKARPTAPQAQTPQAKTEEVSQPAARSISLTEVKSGVAPDGRGKLWAVVIGVSNYKNLRPEEQLRFAHRDAEDMAAFLRSPAGGGFPSTQIKVLLNEEATIASVRTALGTWLPRSAEPNDVVYIFFAGHGVVEQGADGYLLASDSDPQNLYATALPITELDRIITERLRSRVAVVIADACHSGKIGLTSRGVAEEQILINRFLDEVGKSGAGNFRLLASRADERSYEDPRWGGGHGVFTHYLLEGLKGAADRDRDGVVRAGELLDYLSQVVPEQTSALQHPRAAGNIDARLPLAVIPQATASSASTVVTQQQPPAPQQPPSLEVRGPAGSEVYVGNAYRGRIRPEGVLVLDGLSSGNLEISIDLPGAETLKQTVALTTDKTVLDLSTALPARASVQSSPLVDQIREAIDKGRVLESGGAWPLYQQLTRESPDDPQRVSLEIAIIDELDEIGQKAVNNYVRTSAAPFNATQLRQANEAYANLKTLKPGDAQVEAKSLFSAARVKLAEGKVKEAIALLERSMAIDPKTACPYNALGVAYEKTNDIEKALNFYKRAAQLSPGWSLPHYRLGLQYFARGKAKDAQREFELAKNLDPAFLQARWWNAHTYSQQGRYGEAEREAKELIALAPSYTPAYIELGSIYQAAKRYDSAAEIFNKHLQVAPAPASGGNATGSGAAPAPQPAPAQGQPKSN
ncbi:MAG TPA: tetratricopeptide repeat protein [Blastocatellia bacterium]|nr:tetratricopeptide repeat protein [Blastocatellia bacterium]